MYTTVYTAVGVYLCHFSVLRVMMNLPSETALFEVSVASYVSDFIPVKVHDSNRYRNVDDYFRIQFEQYKNLAHLL